MVASPFGTLGALARLRRIATVLARNGFSDLVDRLNLRSYVPLLRRRAAPPQMPRAERAAEVLQELGPSFVKLGQMLSMRPDILPQDFIRAFRRLQDSVRPFPASQARAVIERSLSKTVEEAFETFEPEPVASGSIAQVHLATMPEGRPVVVKIRRPGIETEIKSDLVILRYLAELAERHLPEVRVFHPVEIVEEFGRTINRELDMVSEASSTAGFYQFFEQDPHVVVPEVVWSHTEGDVLTMTRVTGIMLSDIAAIERAGLDRKKLAGIIADSFLRQFFEHGTYHADPHPGNIVAIDSETIGLIDFGAVGHLSDELVSELTAGIWALSNGDVAMIAAVYEEIGVLDEVEHRNAMLAEFQDLLDRYYGMPVDRLDIRKAFSDMVEVARRYNARLPRELVIFGRSLVTALSVVQALDPSVKLSEIIRPYVRRMLVNRAKPGNFLRTGARSGYYLGSLLRNLPSDMRTILRKLKQGRLRFEFRHTGLDDLALELDRASNRLAFSVVTAAIIIGSSYIMGAQVGPSWPVLEAIGLGDVPIMGLLGFLVAGMMGFGLAWAIFRSGKLKG